MSDARAPTKAQGIYEDVTHTLPHVLKKILFAKKTFFEKKYLNRRRIKSITTYI